MPNKYAQIIEKLGGKRSRKSSVYRVDKDCLDKIEKKLDYNLPSDYREFLYDFGGFLFNGAYFPIYIDDRWEDQTVFTFYGTTGGITIAEDYWSQLQLYEPLYDEDMPDDFEWYPGIHLVRDTSSPVRNLFWPPELLRIGCDAGGNQICLALFGLRSGAIFWWRMHPFDDQQNLYLIANSFDEFMHLLKRDSEI